MASKTIRLALFGAGRWARAAHVASLLETEGVRIDAIASSDGSSAQALIDERSQAEALFGANVAAMSTDDLVVALKGGGFEAVLIATPPHTHAELAAAAIGAGLPVLCELPLATDPIAARQLADAAAAAGVLAATTLPRPLLYGGDRVRALLPELGDLQHATLTVRLPDTPLPMLLGLGAAAMTTLFGPGKARADRTVRFDRHPHLTGVLDLQAKAPDGAGFTGLAVEGALGLLRWNWAQPGAIQVDRKDDAPDAGTRDESVAVVGDLGQAFPFARRFVQAVRADATELDGLPTFADGAATIELAASVARSLQG